MSLQVRRHRFRLRCSIRILIDHGYNPLNHILLASVDLRINRLRILLTQIFIEPYFNFALLINAYHVLLYLEIANLVINQVEAFECRQQDVKVVRVWYVLDLTQFDWYPFDIQLGSIMG